MKPTTLFSMKSESLSCIFVDIRNECKTMFKKKKKKEFVEF